MNRSLPPLNRSVAQLVLAATMAVGTTPAAEVSVGSVNGLRGTTVQVPIRFAGEGGFATAIQFQIDYDATTLVSGNTVAGPAAARHQVDSAESVAGARQVVVYSLQNVLLPDGIVATIPFTIPSSALPGKVTVTVGNGIFSDAAGNAVTPEHYSPGTIEINSQPPPILDSVSVNTDGTVQFNISGVPGPYLVDASTDLTTWTTISTNQIVIGHVTFKDPTAPAFHYRYYRARAAQ